jgi:hypothetical protein
MLTDAQFYLRVLEETLTRHGIPCCDELMEADDLREYLEQKLGVKDDEQDDGASGDKAWDHVNLTLQGFVQTLGKRAGIDLKFIPEE